MISNAFQKTTSAYRDHVIDWSKDLGRSIDYLDTRSDIDHNKVAYEGSAGEPPWGHSFPLWKAAESLGTHFSSDFPHIGNFRKMIN